MKLWPKSWNNDQKVEIMTKKLKLVTKKAEISDQKAEISGQKAETSDQISAEISHPKICWN